MTETSWEQEFDVDRQVDLERERARADHAEICPSCGHGTGVQRDDGVWVCARCSYEWRKRRRLVVEHGESLSASGANVHGFVIADANDDYEQIGPRNVGMFSTREDAELAIELLKHEAQR